MCHTNKKKFVWHFLFIKKTEMVKLKGDRKREIVKSFCNEKRSGVRGVYGFPGIGDDIAVFHRKDKNKGSVYIGSAKLTIGGDGNAIMSFDGNEYSEIGELVNAFKCKYDGQRYPIWTDDPIMRTSYRYGMKTKYYMESLGMEWLSGWLWDAHDGSEKYILKDSYGNTKYEISVWIDEKYADSENVLKGKLHRDLDNSSYLETKFEGLEEFESKVNGFIKGDMLLNCVNTISVIGKMVGGSDFSRDKVTVGNDLSVCVEEQKKFLKEELKKALAQLDDEGV